ncbi:hypothetical protein CSUB01_12500 [Colletotrichum sublineola]|uniref:Ketoreductase (KR) domain-containing protein n=1 Tax=Colletotrichum sublineola TaxID=1173701 RepID=A0A066X385_COLSU|nr:hypothetical protein CSUB01_12500 [Colletotrichum sublineola]
MAAAATADDVDFFVMLSSLVGVMGGAGQANYAADSALQDALAQHRRALGKHAATIDLGMVKSLGYVAENSGAGHGVTERLARIGYQALHEEEVMHLIEKAIDLAPWLSPSPNLSRISPGGVVVTGINAFKGAHWTEARWIQEPRFAGLKYREEDGEALRSSSSAGWRKQQGLDCSGGDKEENDARGELGRAVSFDEAVAIVLREMTHKLVRMFGLAEDNDDGVTASKSLSSIGVDSLVAIELRNWISSRPKLGDGLELLLGELEPEGEGPRAGVRVGFVGARGQTCRHQLAWRLL